MWKLNNEGVKEKISEHYLEWNQTVDSDEQGNYYAPDIGDGKGKLIRIDHNGKAQVIAENLITGSDKPYDKHADVLMGVTKGCDGKIYIAELAGQRIIKINDDQSTETFYTSSGDWIPTGIDFFSGDAYILEYKEKNGHAGPRIIKIDEDGNKTELFHFDNYQKGESTSPVENQDNNGDWWGYLLIGTGIIILIILLIIQTKKHPIST